MSILSSFVESFVFQCNNRSYWIPQHFGLTGEYFFAEDARAKKRISAGIIKHPEAEHIKGTVLYFYAGVCNWQYNLPQVLFLLFSGYQVVVFDYAGAGASEGSLTIDGLTEDAQAVFNLLKSAHKIEGKIAVFAQGIGCDAAIRFCSENADQVAALAMESPYASRKGWMRDHWGPLIGDLMANCLSCRTADAQTLVPNLKTPMMVFFPANNLYLPEKQKQAFIKLLDARTRVVDVPKKSYLAVFTGDCNKEQMEVVHFFERHLA